VFGFSTEQKKFKVAGATFGGQPGENATVLFGTVLYGKKYATLAKEARDDVASLIGTQREMSQLTGNPAVVDVFVDTKDRVSERLDLVAGAWDGPISLDVPEAEVRAEALGHCAKAGILDRVIYNSLNLGVTSEELAAMARHPPAAVICLAYNPKDFSTDGRLAMLRTGSGILDKGLLQLAEECGIQNRLLDTGATPFDHSAAECLRAIPVFKHEFGLPVGCAIHNTVESWLWMREWRKAHRPEYELCDAGSNLMPVLLGANYCVYGPMRSARLVFPAVAMADKFVSEGAEDYFGVRAADDHPRGRLR
jgi:tetrahydromethanopterin S-methyltransferase subunit H